MKPSSFVSFPALLLAASLIGLCQFSGDPARAAVLHVPQQYLTITEAANAAVSGDTVLVSHPPEGWYPNEAIVIKPGVSVIGSDHSVRVEIFEGRVTFAAGQDPARFEWFRIRPPANGGEAIVSNNPACEIRNNKFAATNPPWFFSIALLSGGLVEYNQFLSGGDGSGVGVIGYAVIRHNLFSFMNPAVFVDSYPGHVQIYNNNLYQTGLVLSPHQDTVIDVVNNLFMSGSGIWSGSECNTHTSIRYNDFVSGWSYPPECPLAVGNIANVDPMFCAGPNEIYLNAASPVLHAGENGFYMGAYGIGCGVATGVPAVEESPRADIRVEVSPNPVRARTEFRVSGATKPTALEIFDAAGRLVDIIQPGRAPYVWEPGASVRPGVYFVHLRAQEGSATSKCVVLPR